MDIEKLKKMFSNCSCYHVQYEEDGIAITLVKEKAKKKDNNVGFVVEE